MAIKKIALIIGFVVVFSMLFLNLSDVNNASTSSVENEDTLFLGLRTLVYHVDDLAKAKAWYTKAFGVTPYFDEPYYVGFNIGGFELGLDPDMTSISKGNNSVAYWGVADINRIYKHLLEIGAQEYKSVQDVGGGIKAAAVSDPFGNVVGIIENPHFKMEGDTSK